MAQEMGLGVGFLPEALAREAQKKGSLVIKEVEISNNPFHQFIYRKEAKGKALQWFVKELRKKHVINALLGNKAQTKS